MSPEPDKKHEQKKVIGTYWVVRRKDGCYLGAQDDNGYFAWVFSILYRNRFHSKKEAITALNGKSKQEFLNSNGPFRAAKVTVRR